MLTQLVQNIIKRNAQRMGRENWRATRSNQTANQIKFMKKNERYQNIWYKNQLYRHKISINNLAREMNAFTLSHRACCFVGFYEFIFHLTIIMIEAAKKQRSQIY